MRSSKIVAMWIFNKLLAVGLFLTLDGASTRTDPFTIEKKYGKLVNNVVFVRNESLVFVSAAASNEFRLEHTLRLLRSICPTGYEIRTIRSGEYLSCRCIRNTMRGIYRISSLSSRWYY